MDQTLAPGGGGRCFPHGYKRISDRITKGTYTRMHFYVGSPAYNYGRVLHIPFL